MTTLRICFVGDSLMLGTNDEEYLGWPGRLAHREHQAGHDVTIYNLGIRAETSEMISRRWQAEAGPRLLDIHPGALVFAFGSNDMALENGTIRIPLETSCTIAREMMSAAKAWKPVIWIGPPPVDDSRQPFQTAPDIKYDFSCARAAEYSDAYADIAKELDIPYLDLFTPLSTETEWTTAFHGDDGVHPLHPGYAAIAERVAGWDAWRAWFD